VSRRQRQKLRDIKVREETLRRLKVLKAEAGARSYDELLNMLMDAAPESRWRLTKKGEEVLSEVLRRVAETGGRRGDMAGLKTGEETQGG